jgi:acyl-CoA synthetase (NDP forming)
MDEPGADATVLFLSLSLYNTRLRGIYLEALGRVREARPDRLLVVISRGPEDAVRRIDALGIPVFPTIDAAAQGMAGLVRLGRLFDAPSAVGAPVDTAAAPLSPEAFRNEYHAKRVLADAGIPVLPEAIAITADEAVDQARRAGYPVVLKILSEDIPHKTEVGGVALNLADDAAVRAAHERILASAAAGAPRARIDGVLVAPMAGAGTELIMGISRDPVFGPVVMLGFGGIHAEVLRDVAVQVAPVTEAEAESMIRGLKLFPLLDGVRGQPKADIAAAARTVARLSVFAIHHRDSVAEIDMNPVLVKAQGEGVVVLDALMIPARPAG